MYTVFTKSTHSNGLIVPKINTFVYIVIKTKQLLGEFQITCIWWNWLQNYNLYMYIKGNYCQIYKRDNSLKYNKQGKSTVNLQKYKNHSI